MGPRSVLNVNDSGYIRGGYEAAVSLYMSLYSICVYD